MATRSSNWESNVVNRTNGRREADSVKELAIVLARAYLRRVASARRQVRAFSRESAPGAKEPLDLRETERPHVAGREDA
jgi:hypothetical protein